MSGNLRSAPHNEYCTISRTFRSLPDAISVLKNEVHLLVNGPGEVTFLEMQFYTNLTSFYQRVIIKTNPDSTLLHQFYRSKTADTEQQKKGPSLSKVRKFEYSGLGPELNC